MARPATDRCCVSINRLANAHRDLIAACDENYEKPINIPCGQVGGSLNVKVNAMNLPCFKLLIHLSGLGKRKIFLYIILPQNQEINLKERSTDAILCMGFKYYFGNMLLKLMFDIHTMRFCVNVRS
jgi:hypothetical protein